MKTANVRAIIQSLCLRFNHQVARTDKSRIGEHARLRLSLPLVLLATAVALSAGTCRADIQTDSGLVEFMMDTQGLFFSALGVHAGVNRTQTITGTGHVDPQTGTFNWATDGGAQFDGQPLSFTMAGEMDSGGNGVNAGNGSFGGNIAGDGGKDTTSGDSAKTEQTIDLGGRQYVVKGSIKYVWDGGDRLSSATVEMDGKNHTVCDRVHRQDSGRVNTNWSTCDPPQEAGLKFNLNVDNFIDSSGYDTFTATFSPVPEPSSLLLFGSGILGFGGLLRRRLFPRS